MSSHLQENIEEEDYSGSKESNQCMGVVNPETSENQGQVTIDNRSSGIQGPADFPSEVSFTAVFRRVYQTSVCIGGRTFSGILYDQEEVTQVMFGSIDPGNCPSEVSSRATFERIQMDTFVEQYAYKTSVIIGGHLFTGNLYDNDPHQVTADFLARENYSAENIEEDLGSKVGQEEEDSGETDQCLGVPNPETSGNQCQVTIDCPSSENIEEPTEDSGSKETLANQRQVTIDEPTAEQEEVSVSKETDQCLCVTSPETSANQGQFTNDDPSSEYVDEEVSDSKDTVQCLVTGSTETSANQGQVTIDDHCSEQKEDSSSKEADQCLGAANPGTSPNQGQVTNDDPSSEDDLASKETEQALGAVNTETPGNQQGRVTIDKSSSGNIEEQEKESGSQETEQSLGATNLGTLGNQGQISVVHPMSGNSESSRVRKHKVSYKFLEVPYAAIVSGTSIFCDLISEGHYGSMYCGILSDHNQLQVAVKLLNNAVTRFSNDDVAELAHKIGRATHPNIVKFVGYCNELYDRHCLVYEYIPTTLAYYLHDADSTHMPPLGWSTRMRIIHGVAKALHYLHNTVTPRVIHGDLKSSKVLLDGDESSFHPKICGFGFRKRKHAGYCAYAHSHRDEISTKARSRSDEVSTNCDILCFGIVFLELLTGKKAYDEARGSTPWLADWVQRMLRVDEAAIRDRAIEGQVENSTFQKALVLALFCSHRYIKVPDIEEVLTEIEYLVGHKVDYRPKPDFFSELQSLSDAAIAEIEAKVQQSKNNIVRSVRRRTH